MSIDYGERERQFLATLEADSGKPLDAWMAAIRAQGLTHRNDIIDWLRRQGFMFSKASWLERIHNNGGKPIYDGAPSGRRPQTRPRQTSAPITTAPATPATPVAATAPATPAAERPRLTLVAQNPPPTAPVTETPRSAQTAPTASTPVAAPVVPPPAPPAPAKTQAVASTEGSSDQATIDALLARAKAFRPLAVYVTAEIRKRVPNVAVIARDGYLAFTNANGAFSLLVISAKELKLGLALKSPPSGLELEAGKLSGLRGAPPVSHVATLTDARQVTPALMAAIAEAASGA